MRAHFVTGASGFLGRHFVQALLDQGDRVIVLLRDNQEGTAIKRLHALFPNASSRLTCCVGDTTKEGLGLREEDRKEIANLHPELWHLAADLSFNTRDRERVFRTNVDGARHVVRFANMHAKRLWHMSTAYVQGKPQGVMTEDGLAPSPIFRNQYEETKYKAEEIVRTMTTIPFLIIRPSIILGNAYREKALGCAFGYYRYLHIFYRFRGWIISILHAGHAGNLLLRSLGTRMRGDGAILSLPWLFLPGPSGGKVNVVPVSYVVNAMLFLLEREHAQGTTLHLVHDDPPTYTFLLNALLSDLRIRSVHHFPVPMGIFVMALRLLRVLAPSVRVYAHSALWYVPYINDIYNFETTRTRALGISPPPKITNEYMSTINNGAISAIEKAH